MRTTNGRFTTNRLPLDTAGKAAAVGKSLGSAALTALVVVVTTRVIDTVFQAIVEKRQARRGRAAKAEEVMAA